MRRELIILGLLPLGGCWELVCSYLDPTQSCSADSPAPGPETAISCKLKTSLAGAPATRQLGFSVAFAGNTLLTGSPGGTTRYSESDLVNSARESPAQGDGYSLSVDPTSNLVLTSSGITTDTTSAGTDVRCASMPSATTFGRSLAATSGYVFIGDPTAGPTMAGIVYPVTRPCANLTLTEADGQMNPSGLMNTSAFGASLAASGQQIVALGGYMTEGRAWISQQSPIAWSLLAAPGGGCRFLATDTMGTLLPRPDQYLSMTDSMLLVSCLAGAGTAPNAVRYYLPQGVGSKDWQPHSTPPVPDDSLKDATKISLSQGGQVAVIGVLTATGPGAAWAVRWSAAQQTWSTPVSLRPAQTPGASYGNSVAASPDGKLVAVGEPDSGDGAVHVFECGP